MTGLLHLLKVQHDNNPQIITIQNWFLPKSSIFSHRKKSSHLRMNEKKPYYTQYLYRCLTKI